VGFHCSAIIDPPPLPALVQTHVNVGIEFPETDPTSTYCKVTSEEILFISENSVADKIYAFVTMVYQLIKLPQF
jgi:hypothetical protein